MSLPIEILSDAVNTITIVTFRSELRYYISNLTMCVVFLPQKPTDELGRSYVNFLRASMDQTRQKITDELYTLNIFEVGADIWREVTVICYVRRNAVELFIFTAPRVASGFDFTHIHTHTLTYTQYRLYERKRSQGRLAKAWDCHIFKEHRLVDSSVR